MDTLNIFQRKNEQQQTNRSFDVEEAPLLVQAELGHRVIS